MQDRVAEAWAALDKPLFDLEWAAAAGEDTAEARAVADAAVRDAMVAVLDESIPPSLRGMLPQVMTWQEVLRAQIQAFGAKPPAEGGERK